MPVPSPGREEGGHVPLPALVAKQAAGHKSPVLAVPASLGQELVGAQGGGVFLLSYRCSAGGGRGLPEGFTVRVAFAAAGICSSHRSHWDDCWVLRSGRGSYPY